MIISRQTMMGSFYDEKVIFCNMEKRGTLS